MEFDKNGFPISTPEPEPDARTSDPAVQAALASLATQAHTPRQPRPGEIKWRLTTLVYPAILLLFVALYVTSLSAGVEPEVALFWAGGASVVLAMLGRVAVGILGDDTRLVLDDSQIVAMARNGAVREHLSSAEAGQGSGGTDQPSTAAQTVGAGGKE